MKKGNGNRAVTATNMNAESSRSHSMFILTLVQTNNEDQSSRTGKLYLVDLAGSEKVSKTGAVGQTFEEAKNINQSLTTLGKVIVALTDKKITHIPYRESKLTRVLSESLGGNSKTTLIVTTSPHPYNEAETLSTLRFGARARNIQNVAKVNREFSIPELKKMLAEAQGRVSYLEGNVKALVAQIIALGGKPPSESELIKMSKKIEADAAVKKEEEVKSPSVIDSISELELEDNLQIVSTQDNSLLLE